MSLPLLLTKRHLDPHSSIHVRDTIFFRRNAKENNGNEHGGNCPPITFGTIHRYLTRVLSYGLER